MIAAGHGTGDFGVPAAAPPAQRAGARSLGMGLGLSTLLSALIVGSLVAPLGGLARSVADVFYVLLFTALLLCALQYLLFASNLRRMPLHLIVSTGSLLLLYGLSFLWSSDRLTAVKHIASMSSILFIVFALTNLRWNRAVLVRIMLAGSLFVLANFVFWLGSGMTFRSSGIYTHRNSMAAVSYYFLFFPLAIRLAYPTRGALKSLCLAISAVALILVVAAASRAVFLAGITTALTYWLWPRITRRRIRHVGYFVLLLASVVATTIVYAYLQGWLIGADALNVQVRGVTGGNLFSGRQAFWTDILQLIAQRPVIGWGSGALPQNLLGQDLSAHSLFLQLTLQIGILGLGLLFLFFLSIWTTFYRGRDLLIVRLAAAFFAGSMVRETFAVTLLQNQLVGIGSFAWVVFAIGIHFATAATRTTTLTPASPEAA